MATRAFLFLCRARARARARHVQHEIFVLCRVFGHFLSQNASRARAQGSLLLSNCKNHGFLRPLTSPWSCLTRRLSKRLLTSLLLSLTEAIMATRALLLLAWLRPMTASLLVLLSSLQSRFRHSPSLEDRLEDRLLLQA